MSTSDCRPTDNLGELFRTARQYGRVRIFTLEDGAYHCCIQFNSIKHTALEAKSDFKQPTPEDALRAAIIAAESIVDSVSSIKREQQKRLA